MGPRKPTSQLADSALLDKIDKLFSCGVGELVNLPQLVVVGDQSSGKSSVLEGLTKLPFPRDKELCTRFATAITFRRSQHSEVKHISISIIPSPNAPQDHKTKMLAWSRPDMTTLETANFAAMILEVQELMGLNKIPDSHSSGRANFSEDILKIEITGPNEEHFSIVDVPGIFRNVEFGKTTKKDITLVENMVKGYMKNPRSVMLTVIPANVDTATQEILSMAAEVVSKGVRTLGVLTKPDLVDRGAEQSALDLLNGRRYQLALGWQLVKNTGQNDLQDKTHDRDASELDFFQNNAPWSELSRDKYGVQSLREKLQYILARHIKSEFPHVRSEIAERLKSARSKIKSLGAQRSTPNEIRSYLLDVCTGFERTMTDALHKRYTSATFRNHPELRLPTLLIDRQDEFANDMMDIGHTYAFKYNDQGNEVEAKSKDNINAEAEVPSEVDKAEKYIARRTPMFPQLADCTIDDSEHVSEPLTGILEWLTDEHANSRGFELGGIDPSLLPTVFQTQAKKWDVLALGYVSDAIEIVHNFLLSLLEILIPDDRVRENLTANLIDELQFRYKCAFKHVQFLLDVETDNLPNTANHYFNDNLEKARQARVRKAAEKFSFKAYTAVDDKYKIDRRPVIHIDQLSHTDNMTNKEYIVRDFHDVLQAHYKVVLKRFIDNTTHQAGLYHLVTGPKAPLKLFSAAYVGALTDEQLVEIAGEDKLAREKREALAKEIATLEKGKKSI